MLRLRATAALVAGVLVFYNTGTLLGLHGHASPSGATVHAHGTQYSANHSHQGHTHHHNHHHADHGDAEQTAVESTGIGPASEPTSEPTSEAALVLALPAAHLDYALLSEFILNSGKSDAVATALPASVLIEFRPEAPVLMPATRSVSYHFRIRDGIRPDWPILSIGLAGRAPPRLS